MDNKKNISRISELTSTLKEVKFHLENEKKLSRKDVLMFSDILDELTLTSFKINEKSKNIFTKVSIKNIANSIEDVFSKIADIENQRHLDDDEILKDIYQISFKEDCLELNFFELLPSDIEMILSSLDEDIQKVLEKKPYNERLINPIIQRIQKKLIDLHFRFDFPIVEELDENKNSYAHRLIMVANEMENLHPKKARFLIKKIDELLDLVWIAKMFMYGDFSKAKNLFEQLDNKTKSKVEKLLWRLKGETIKKINDEKKFDVSKALMHYVAQKINA